VTIGGKHPDFRESVSLRGKASERRSWPIRDVERGPSPPGKPGAMDHARRGGSSPGFRGSRWVTWDARLPSKEGSSQEAQKAASPSLQDSRSVAVPRLAFGKPRVGGRRRIRFRSCFHGALCTARSSGQPDGRTMRKRLGNACLATSTSSCGGRGGGLVDVLVRSICLVAEVDKRLGPKKPFLQTHSPFGGGGERGERGPGLRMTIVQSRVRCSFGPRF
jgi:hypothetical protein